MSVQDGPVSTPPGYPIVQILHGREKCLAVKADPGLLIGEDSHNPSFFQGISLEGKMLFHF